jgi:hypothetical protein
MTLVRYVWAAGPTLIGLLLALVGSWRGRICIVNGVIEAHGPLLRRLLHACSPLDGPIAAITFGHVVLGSGPDELVHTRAHERVHVRQYERWGIFFIPAYLLASMWAHWQGGHPYLDNAFEREAYRIG